MASTVEISVAIQHRRSYRKSAREKGLLRRAEQSPDQTPL